MITMVVACSSNKVIGKDNTLVWKVPGDLKRFKEMTTGKVIVMGRKTYESIGKPLPNRKNVIITRNIEYKVDGCEVYSSIEEVIKLYGDDMFVIGGGEIYNQFLNIANAIELTLIHKDFEGDAYFPEIPDSFMEVKREDLECDDFKYSYITYYSYKLRSTDIVNEGWILPGAPKNGGSKYFIKDRYMLTYNGENSTFLKDKKRLLPMVEIVDITNTSKPKVLFEGDIFNKQQLKDSLNFIVK